jgi:ectoine hydroxylase-related dioxygenase (phytanoyl-CoA dioxygenase family)
VMSAVAQVLDGDVNLLGFRGRDPRPGSGQQGFHVDFATPVPPDRQCIVNVFWLLDDMDESNGATRFVPGSHRLARVPSRSLSQPDARHAEAVQVPARAGDAIVFSAHLWHAGSKNRSGAPRRIAMAMFGRSDMLRTFDERGYLRALQESPSASI